MLELGIGRRGTLREIEAVGLGRVTRSQSRAMHLTNPNPSPWSYNKLPDSVPPYYLLYFT
jgi:hypothetical protein